MSAVRMATGVMLAVAAGSAAATNGYFSHGYGAKAKGMAGAGIAFPQDAIAPATNPAGIAKVPERFDFGMDYFVPSRGASIRDNFFGPDQDFDGDGKKYFFVPDVGYVSAINERWSWGLAAYGNGGMNTTYREANPFGRFGSNGTAGVDLAQLFISPTIAVKLTESQSVGVALNYVYQQFKAFGLGAFAGTSFPGPFSDSPRDVTNQGYDNSTGLGVRLGWLGQFGDVSLGASWQPKIKMSKFHQYQGLFAEQGGFDIPETYGVGLAWQATEALTFAADVQRIKYGDVPSIANPLSNFQNPNSLLATLTGALPPQVAGAIGGVVDSFPGGENLLTVIDLINGSPIAGVVTALTGSLADAQFGNRLGSDNGPGFGWQDITVHKLGVNYRLNPLIELRAGYSNTDQPIPRDQTFFNILAPGIVRQHYTAGATFSILPHEVTVHYLHAPKVTVRGRSSIPDALLPLPPDSFGGGEADIHLEEKSYGISYAYRF